MKRQPSNDAFETIEVEYQRQPGPVDVTAPCGDGRPLPQTFVPDMGVVEWLPRIVGTGRAKELIFLAEPIDAAEAHRIGIINTLVAESDDLEAVASTATQRLATGPPLALRHAKRLIHLAFDNEGTAIAASLEAQLECLASADFAEAGVALLENRQPVFTGR
jgi:2-(1,2-epoxy-1,2-dihydrophenyl)acetyl-CoA isomerase